MKVTFSPESGQVQEWTFDPKRIKVAKAEMIEKRAEETFQEWMQGVRVGKSRARRVLLWHCLSVDHPAYRWEDTPDFYVDELAVDFERHEIVEIRAAVQEARIPADKKQAALDVLDAQLETFPADANPKAESPTSETATGAS